MLRSDRDGEYGLSFVDVCAQHGIMHETTTPYSPQSHRVVMSIFYTHFIPMFCIVFMINKCPNALNVHLYDWMHMSGIEPKKEQNDEKAVIQHVVVALVNF